MKKIRLAVILTVLPFSLLANELIVLGQANKKPIYSHGQSVNFFDENEIKQINANGLKDIFKFSANTNSASGGNTTKYFQIRSVGERSSYEGMPNSSIGLIIDNIDYTGINGSANIEDAKDIRIYKGPQASRYGTSALGGVIHIDTMAPSTKKSLQLRQNIEQNNTFKTSISLAKRIAKKLSYSMDLTKVNTDGFITNEYKGKKTQFTNTSTAKMKVKYKGNKNELLYTYHFHHQNNGHDIFNHNNDYKTQSDRPGVDNLNTNAHAISYKTLIHGKTEQETQLSFINNANTFSYDEDWGNNQYWKSVQGWNKNYDYDIEFSKKIQKTQLDHKYVFNNTHLGIFVKKTTEQFKEKSFKNNELRKSNEGDYKLENIGVFGNKVFNLSPMNQIEIGYRIENWKANFKDTASAFSPKSILHGGEIIYTFNKSDSNTYKIKLAKGYKAGGINTQKKIEESRKEYEKEELYLIELGQSYYTDNFDISYNFFFMYRDDIQLKSSYQDDPNDPSSYTFYTDNGTSAQVQGFEGNIEYRVNRVLTSKLSIGLMKSKYNKYILGDVELTNRSLPHSPSYQLALRNEFKFNSKWTFNYNTTLNDEFYFSNSHNKKSRKAITADLGLSYAHNKVFYKFFINNVFNEYYSQRGYFFSNEPPHWKDKLYKQPARPRHIGFQIQYNY